jgi:hydrogenase maturation protease
LSAPDSRGLTPSDPVRRIADAVLYEGYVLWPYRRSALKNQRRWTFGGIHPAAHSARREDDPCELRAECLIEGEPDVRVAVRFLHVVHRQPTHAGKPVDELCSGGERHLAWDEAVEREIELDLGGERAIDVPAGREREALDGEDAIERSWARLVGGVRTDAIELSPGLHRVGVRVRNDSPFAGGDREAALLQTFCSTHVVLHARGGAFVSLTDPPPEHAQAAADCVNEGVWPVLAGEPGDRSTVLASPIILEDHPQIAPESPGDLFDGGEIDQMLVLNILSLTDEERRDMRDADPRTREILERTEALSEEELMRLHGAIREFGMVRR